MEKKFKCKDEVIYRRNDEEDVWTYGVFSHYYKYHNVDGMVASGHPLLSTVYEILPYEGNEHLVGTTDSPDEEVRLKEGELLIYFENIKFLERLDLFLARFDGIINDLIKVKTDCMKKWEYAIRFKDFDPSNMEETKKHILCVKNGKIVKYKS